MSLQFFNYSHRSFSKSECVFYSINEAKDANYSQNQKPSIQYQMRTVNKSVSPLKPLNCAPIRKTIKTLPNEDLCIHSNLKESSKIDSEAALEQSNKILNPLLKKLAKLEEKQKQNQKIFNDCIKSLKQEIAIKDHINLSLRHQISQLRQQLMEIKREINKSAISSQTSPIFDKLSQAIKQNLSKGPKKGNSLTIKKSQSQEKQNIRQYMMQKLNPWKDSKKLSKRQNKIIQQTSEQQINKKSSYSKFRIKDFIKNSTFQKVNQYYHHHTTITDQQISSLTQKKPFKLIDSSSLGRATKTKSTQHSLNHKISTNSK